jgi:hypothetical protein
MQLRNIAITLAFAMGSLYAQENEMPAINTDRTGLSESSAVVPKGVLQVESGANFEWDKSGNINFQNIIYNGTVARYGVSENFEARLGFNLGQNFFRSPILSGNTAFGLMPMSFGFKAQISEQKGFIPTASVELMLYVPYLASKDFKTDYIFPTLIVPFSWNIGSSFSTMINLGMLWNGQNALPTYFCASYNALALPKGFTLFFEGYFLAADNSFRPGINGGVIWQPKPNFQLDISVGTALNSQTADGFINGGIAFYLNTKK